MKIGTKSLLFGVHQFLIHPFFVFVGWWKLYGFPRDYRIWIAIIIHDWGYWGMSNMDGKEGDYHPVWAAIKFTIRFDQHSEKKSMVPTTGKPCDTCASGKSSGCYEKWGKFLLYHSRFLAKKLYGKPSRLCWADKLCVSLMPWWLYIPLGMLTGEIDEYMADSQNGKTASEHNRKYKTRREWFKNVQRICKELAFDNSGAP